MNYAIQIIENDAVICGIGVPVDVDPYKFIPRVIDELFTIWRTHVLPVREVRLSSGAEFIVVVCGEIMTMPGLPRVPAADSIKLNKINSLYFLIFYVISPA